MSRLRVRLNIFHAYYSPAFLAGGPIQSIKALCETLDKEIEIGVLCSSKDLDGSLLDVQVNEWVNSMDGEGHKVCYAPSWWFLWTQVRTAQCTYVNGIFSMRYNLFPLLFAKGKRVLSVRGMLAKQALNKKRFKKRVYLIFLKFLLHLRPVTFHATSQQEAEDIAGFYGDKANIKLIPNITLGAKVHAPLYRKDILKIGTIALISQMKNHHVVLEALGKLECEVEYQIWGPVMDPDYWRKCEGLIKQLPPNIKVYYKGPCSPAEVVTKLAETHVVVQPSESENYGHSLVESLLCGRPVMTSHTTPWNELRENLAGLNVYPVAEEVAEAILFFQKMDNPEIEDWCKGAQLYIADRLNISNFKSEYIKLFTEK